MISVKQRPFDTDVFFSGGAGMFIQYHDIIKPVYLYAVIQMIITEQSHGIPIDIIKCFSIASIIEWYKNRKHINPLRQLDYMQLYDDSIDDLLYDILSHDESIYTLCPQLPTCRMFQVCIQQKLSFPIFIYSERKDPFIENDCAKVLSGLNFKYLYGDLKKAIENCQQNFTYIFSDIEMVKNASELLKGTCSHILLARDYRYNYFDHFNHMKYDLEILAKSHPFIRTGTILGMDVSLMGDAFQDVLNV